MPAKRRNPMYVNNLRPLHGFGIAFAKELLPKVTAGS